MPIVTQRCLICGEDVPFSRRQFRTPDHIVFMPEIGIVWLATMHQECIRNWPRRDELVRRINEVAGKRIAVVDRYGGIRNRFRLGRFLLIATAVAIYPVVLLVQVPVEWCRNWFRKQVILPRCPACGKPLRTALARQCFHCGKAWHMTAEDGGNRGP
jgi:hypothetical protein